LSEDSGANVSNTIRSCRPASDVSRVVDRKDFLDEADLGNGSLLFVAVYELRPGSVRIIGCKESLFPILYVSFEKADDLFVVPFPIFVRSRVGSRIRLWDVPVEVIVHFGHLHDFYNLLVPFRPIVF
jgi:hypothetical protein